MNKHDPQIDAVLTALRRAEPRPGLEDRVLARLRLEEAAAAPPQATGWQIAALFAAPMPWLALAALLLAAAGTLVLHDGAVWHKTSRGEARSASAAVVSSHLRSDFRPTVQQRAWSTPDPEVLPTQRVARASEKGGFKLVPQAAALASGGADLPPTPLPLTEQERLLLRLVRQEQPRQLAPLSNPAQDAVFQREKDAVTEFFAPPPPLDQDLSAYDSLTGQQ